MDLLVLFAGTGQEPDRPDGRGKTLVWQLGHLLEGLAFYEPGVGTMGIPLLSKIAQALGDGVEGRVDDMLDRLMYYPKYRVSVFGESRGAHSARVFAQAYQERYGRQVHLFVAIDSVTAVGWGAFVRLLPRRFWRRPVYPRPPAAHALHFVALAEPDRFYVHDDLLGMDEVVPFENMRHGDLLRDAKAVQIVSELVLKYDLHLRVREDDLPPLEPTAGSVP